MTLFELVKLAIDELYETAIPTYGGQKALDAEIRRELKSLSRAYGQLTQGAGTAISFEQPATRIAYVYSYVAAHADYIYSALRDLSDEIDCGRVFTTGRPRVCCIGSGPGTDLLGIRKYLLRHAVEDVTTLTAYLLDQEAANWAEPRTALAQALTDSGLTTPRPKTKSRLFVADETRPWQGRKKPAAADLFTLSYFVSQASAADPEAVADSLREMFRRAKRGALILYVDNNSTSLTNYFDNIWDDMGLELLLDFSGDRNMHYSEEMSALDPYPDKFKRHPKLHSNICVRGLRKPT